MNNTKRLWIYNVLASLLPESRCYGIKNAILRWAGLRIGENVRIYSSARFMGSGGIYIGNDVHIGPQCLFFSAGGSKIEIGDCVDIAPRVTIVTGAHKLDPLGKHIAGDGISKSVFVGNGCWLSLGCSILPGVSLAEKTVAAAGAVVVNGTTDKLCLIAGAPAEVKKKY